MSIIDKCYEFQEARQAIALGYYPYFREITSEQDTEVICNGQKMLMLGSNSYLGLTNHPRVKEASIRAIQKYGSGCAGSRFLNGTLDIHLELEAALAQLMGKEAALSFPTGYQANLGCISAMVLKDEYVITDKYDHASIIDGSLLSQGTMLRYNHNDMTHLERILSKIEGKNSLIVVDGIFSMEGDIADLPAICALAEKYGSNVMVDEAHSLGVLGATGAGAAEHFGLIKQSDFLMGTFSKSLASVGGFIAADEDLIHYLKHKSRALIFSASLPPASTASALEAIK
ncbi:MAG: pyridoxal phosphate-dependent aminotransferase family protein, partial [Candidatus Cloacimonetes bacterium]|nr:pyridoxal phosphate-dependent aminotransferase family protein [Candidatus Cloacimonadota bacterium]